MKGSLTPNRIDLYLTGIFGAIILYNVGVHYNIIWMIPLAVVILFLTVWLYVKFNPRFYQKSEEQKIAGAQSDGNQRPSIENPWPPPAEYPPDEPRELPPKFSDTLVGKPTDIFDDEAEEERIRQKLKDEQNSPFGRWVSQGDSLVFRLYPEETIIENLRKKGYKITKP